MTDAIINFLSFGNSIMLSLGVYFNAFILNVSFELSLPECVCAPMLIKLSRAKNNYVFFVILPIKALPWKTVCINIYK